MKKIKVNLSAEELKKKLNLKDGYTPQKGIDYFDGVTPEINASEIAVEASKLAQVELEKKIQQITPVIEPFKLTDKDIEDISLDVQSQILPNLNKEIENLKKGFANWKPTGGNTEVFEDGIKVGSGQALNFGAGFDVTHDGHKATINLDITEQPSDYIDFDTTATYTSQEGRLGWNSDDGTLQVGMPGGNVSLQIGQEMIIRAKATENISNGDVVYISGASGQKPEVTKARADLEATAHKTIGVATEDITSGQQGYVTTFGYVRDINTSGFTAGDELYLSSTTAGAITNTEPLGSYIVHIGHCVYSHATEGKILVNIDIVHSADEVKLEGIGTPTYSTVQQMQDIYHSTGLADGGTITDNGDGTYAVASGSGYIRPTNDATDTLLAFDFSANASITPAQEGRNYVGVEYNAGSPQIVQRTSYTWNYQTDFPLGEVVKENSTLHIWNAPQKVGDHAGKMIEAMEETMPLARDNRNGGLIIGETGTRNITLTSGKLWFGLNDYVIPALDTSVSGSFEAYYRNGSGGWTLVTGLTQWNNTQYDDNSGTLQSMTVNRYANNWFYTDADDGNVVMIYPQNQYTTLAQALDASPPSTIPARLLSHGKLLGRIIFLTNGATATEIQTVFDTMFSTTGVTNHNDLASLQGGTTGEYYHLTSAQATAVAGLGTTYVPYTGASANVDLGAYYLKTSGGIGINHTPTKITAHGSDYPALFIGNKNFFFEFLDNNNREVFAHGFATLTTDPQLVSSSDLLYYVNQPYVGSKEMHYLVNATNFYYNAGLGLGTAFRIGASANFYVPVVFQASTSFLSFLPFLYDNSGLIDIGPSSFPPTTDLSGVISTYGTACNTSYSVPDPALWEHKYMIKLFDRGNFVKPIYVAGYTAVSGSSGSV